MLCFLGLFVVHIIIRLLPIKIYLLARPRLQKRNLAAEGSVTNITRAVSLRNRLAEVE